MDSTKTIEITVRVIDEKTKKKLKNKLSLPYNDETLTQQYSLTLSDGGPLIHPVKKPPLM